MSTVVLTSGFGAAGGPRFATGKSGTDVVSDVIAHVNRICTILRAQMPSLPVEVERIPSSESSGALAFESLGPLCSEMVGPFAW